MATPVNGRPGVNYFNVTGPGDGSHALLVAEWRKPLELAMTIRGLKRISHFVAEARVAYPLINVAEAIRVHVAVTIADAKFIVASRLKERVQLVMDGFFEELGSDP